MIETIVNYLIHRGITTSPDIIFSWWSSSGAILAPGLQQHFWILWKSEWRFSRFDPCFIIIMEWIIYRNSDPADIQFVHHLLISWEPSNLQTRDPEFLKYWRFISPISWFHVILSSSVINILISNAVTTIPETWIPVIKIPGLTFDLTGTATKWVINRQNNRLIFSNNGLKNNYNNNDNCCNLR